ncbi:unnamed protein product [Pylaiella littoralis]
MQVSSGQRWRLEPGYFSRWSSLSAAVVVNIFAVYAYGLFSDTLKETLGFSQSSVDMIASIGEAGQWSTFIVGLILERKSSRQVYAIGSVASGVGLGYVSLAIGKIVPTNPALMGAFFYLANFGSACFAQTATSTVLRNFPATDRGKVAGMMKSIFGLSSAVLSVLYAGLFNASDVGKFLLLLSVGVPLLGAISSIPLNVVPTKHLSYATERFQRVEPRMKPFYNWFAAVVLFLIAAVSPLPFALPVPWTGIFLAVLVLSVCALPYCYGCIYIRLATLGVSRENSSDCYGGEADTRSVSDVGQGMACELAMDEDYLFGRETRPLLGTADVAELSRRSLTWKQCLRDIRFWALFLSFLCGAGSGLVVINNVASLADSLEMASGSLLVSIIGISNALGRISVGWISDRIVVAGLPRSLLYCAMLLTTCGVDFLLAAGIPALLYPLCVGAGVCYGSMFALVLALAADLFGPDHLGTNYGLLDLEGPAVGSFVYATGVVSLFYRDNSMDNHGGTPGNCIGPSCFGGTFLVTAVSCLGACILVYIVLVRPTFNARLRRAEL